MAHTTLLTACHKGGTTKSTTTVNFAYSWAVTTGHKVLVIDLDPQGNATRGLGLRDVSAASTMDVLTRGADIVGSAMHVASATAWFDDTPVPDGLYLLPADKSLNEAKVKLASDPTSLFNLVNAIDDLDDSWLVIIDTGPDMSALTAASVAAATDVVVPTVPRFADYEGALAMWPTIKEMATKLRAPVNMAGLLLGAVDGRDRSNVKRTVIEQSRASDLDGGVFDTEIRDDVRVKESYAAGLPVGAYEPDCGGAKDMLAAAIEFLTVRSSAARGIEGEPDPVALTSRTLPAWWLEDDDPAVATTPATA